MVKKIVFSLRYLVLALLALSFLGACTPKKTSPVNDSLAEQSKTVADADDDDEDEVAWESDNDANATPTERLAKSYSRNHRATGSTGELLQKARTALGTPYVPGGTSRNGFDCSGFVQWSYSSVGIQLPRTAREQSQVGTPIRRMDDMQAGDIVAFRHPRRGYHTGIYVGDGKFIHSPRKRNVVRINALDDPYFSKTFMGARRLNVSNEGDIEAAEQMLVAYAKQPPSPKASSSRSSKKKQDKSSRRAIASKKSTGKIVAVNSAKSTKNSSKVEKSSSKNSSKSSTTSDKSNKKKSQATSVKSSDKKSISSTSKKNTNDKSSKSTSTAKSKSSAKGASTKTANSKK